MKKIILSWLILVGLTLCASAQVPMTGAGKGAPGGGACVNSTETCAWSAQVVTNGGSTPTTTQLNLVDTFVACVKASSNIGPALNTVLTRFYPLANADNSTVQSRTSIVNPGSAATSSGSFSSTTNGYTGDGSTAFLDTGFASGSGFTATSASYGVYIKNARTTGTTIIDMGSYDGTNISQLLPVSAAGNALGFINSLASANTVTNTSSAGFFIETRNSTTTTLYQYQSASPTSQSTAVTGSTSSFSFYIMARNNSGTADSFAADQLLAAFLGAGVSSSSAANDLASCTNGMMTTLGLNVW